MNTQARKNIRQAFPVIVHGTLAYEVTQVAARWAAESSTHTKFLDDLDLLTIAHRALVTGDTLEEIGETGPYGTASQRRAWAAGRLAAACHAIHAAERIETDKSELLRRIAWLERQAELLRAETRAAARFREINTPFRVKRKPAVNWDAA